jgi:hypothetical protein
MVSLNNKSNEIHLYLLVYINNTKRFKHKIIIKHKLVQKIDLRRHFKDENHTK